jgi:hypothetical protein
MESRSMPPVSAPTDGGFYERIGQWFLAEPARRAVTPF